MVPSPAFGRGIGCGKSNFKTRSEQICDGIALVDTPDLSSGRWSNSESTCCLGRRGAAASAVTCYLRQTLDLAEDRSNAYASPPSETACSGSASSAVRIARNAPKSTFRFAYFLNHKAYSSDITIKLGEQMMSPFTVTTIRKIGKSRSSILAKTR